MIIVVFQLENQSRAPKIKISVMCKRAKEFMSECSVAGELMAWIVLDDKFCLDFIKLV